MSLTINEEGRIVDALASSVSEPVVSVREVSNEEILDDPEIMEDDNDYEEAPIQITNRTEPTKKEIKQAEEKKEEVTPPPRLNYREVSMPPDSLLILPRSLKTKDWFVLRDYYLGEETTLRKIESSHGVSKFDPVLVFDKNFNGVVRVVPETVNAEYLSKSFPRINFQHTKVQIYYNSGTTIDSYSYLIIDKKRLFESKGEDIKILINSEVDKEKEEKTITRFKNMIAAAKANADQIRSIVSTFYDEEDFEIINYLVVDEGIFKSGYIRMFFEITLLHHDITITNSIEQSHYIGEIATNLSGNVMINPNIREPSESFSIDTSLRGLRMTHNPNDIAFGYSHSHLPTRGGNVGCKFEEFCLGHQDHMFMITRYNQDGQTTIMELEGILLGIQDYVKWESLEGGPHKKMEQLNNLGEAIVTRDSARGVTGAFMTEYFDSDATGEVYKLFHSLLPEFKPFFNIVKKGNKAKFVANHNAIARKFTELVHQNIFRNLYSKFGLDKVVYSSDRDDFFYIQVNLNWQQKVELAKEKFNKMLPVYINGKMVNHTLTIPEKEPEDDNTLILTVHPMVIRLITNNYLFILNKELENEYRKR